MVCILHLATSFLFTVDCVQRETDQARSRAIHIHGRPRIVCVTARLDVTPKTTEQNRIVCTGKSEAEVTNNLKKLRSRYCTIEAMKLTTDRCEASRGLLATAELLVEFQRCKEALLFLWLLLYFCLQF